jgi:excisionase family DNA binding protein
VQRIRSRVMRPVSETTYVYKTLPLDHSNLTEQRLNGLGAEGWMLVATLPQLVFVRSIQRLSAVQIDAPILLTIKQVSERLGISRSKLYHHINSGQLNCIRIGRSVRIPRQELEIFIREHQMLT